MSKHAKDETAEATLNIMVQDPSYTPTKGHSEDACFDLYATGDYTLEPNSATSIPTGVRFDFGESIWAKVEGRSSLAKQAIFPIGGVIDPGYQGEIVVILYNGSEKEYEIKEGERVAQIALFPHYPVSLQTVESFATETSRSENGFGSTGK